MQHSIAVRHAAWSSARFDRPAARAQERRLGLRTAPGFVAASTHRTVLRHGEPAPLTALLAPWRAVRPVTPRVAVGSPRPVTTMLWIRSARSGRPRRSQAATAWRG
jgi:hypothetical protein